MKIAEDYHIAYDPKGRPERGKPVTPEQKKEWEMRQLQKNFREWRGKALSDLNGDYRILTDRAEQFAPTDRDAPFPKDFVSAYNDRTLVEFYIGVLETASQENQISLYQSERTIMLNPIIDWTDADVWEFIHTYSIPYCELYDSGCTRLGCVGCPMGGYAAQRRELKRWPQYRKLYVSAFDDMLEARRRDGKLNHSSLWQSGEGVMQWWTGYERKTQSGQINLFSPIYHESNKSIVSGG